VPGKDQNGVQCEGVLAPIRANCHRKRRDGVGSRVWVECEIGSVLKTFVVKVVEGKGDDGGSAQGVIGEVDGCRNVDNGGAVGVKNGPGEQM
jgi:hypothetical protein